MGLGEPILNLVGGLQRVDCFGGVDHFLPAVGVSGAFSGSGEFEQMLTAPGLFQLFDDCCWPRVTVEYPLEALNAAGQSPCRKAPRACG